MDESLESILKTYHLIDLKQFLSRVLIYGKSKLGCQGGTAFLFDRATGLLKLRGNTWQSGGRHFSLHPGQGFAGKAYEAKTLYCLPTRTQTLADIFIPPPFFQIKEISLGSAFPILVENQVEAVFCFYFSPKDQKSLWQPDASENMTKDVKSVWDEFQTSQLGCAIQRMQMHGIPGKIHQAGQSTARLTTEVSHFISGLRQKFDKKGWDKPKMFYVQLKDTARNLIQTVQGFSEPNKLHVSSFHSLDSQDINADVVRNRSVEMISGFDDRFDHHVYKKYNHKNYARIWIPLFPFSLGELPNNTSRCLADRLAQIMCWENIKYVPGKSIGQKGNWIEGHLPPKEMVYGVLEIGYRLENSEAPSLGPWTPKFAMEVMALVYRCSIPLFRVTLPGVMDRIGRLMASAPFNCEMVFDCLFPSKGRKERRRYPMDSKWPVAVPQLLNDTDLQNPCNSGNLNDIRVYPYNKKPVSICFASPTPITPSMKDLWQQNAMAAREAVETAFKLYEAVMAPIMLIERDKDLENVGTFIKDTVIKTIIEDAARSNGAEHAAFFAFEDPQKTDANDSPPPVQWPEKNKSGFDSITIKAHAFDAAKEQSYHYEPVKLGQPTCFLPMGLKEKTVGVIALGFSQEQLFDPGTRMDLERQSLLWRFSLVLHRFILRKRFANLMMHRRQDIIEAKKQALEEKVSSNPLDVFIKTFLSSTKKHLKINAAVLSRFDPAQKGPSRLRLYWSDTGNEAHAYEFFNIEKHASCKAFLGEDQVEVFRGEDLDDCRAEVGQFLSGYRNQLEEYGEQADLEILDRLSTICQGGNTKSVLMIPIHLTGNGVSKINIGTRQMTKGWCYLLLKEAHFFRGIHKRLTFELGQQIGRAIEQVRTTQAQTQRKALDQKVDQRIKRFEGASSVNEIIHGFLKGLGKWPDHNNRNNNSHKEDYFDIAEHAVIWTYSIERKELVARSGRGKALDALCSESMDILDLDAHPVFKGRVHPRKHYPRLQNERFKFHTLELGSVNMPSSFKPLCTAYQKGTGLKWLISFPMVDPSDKIFGAFDLVRDHPLPAESEQVIEQVFLRISRRLNSQAEKVRLKQVSLITEKLFRKAKDCIEQARLFPVYNELAELLRKEFNCAQCDIFVERHDKYYLYGSTHPSAPNDERERARHWFQKTTSQSDAFDRAEIFDRALEIKRPCIAHEWDPKLTMSHFSHSLQKFLAKAKEPERLILPLKPRKEAADNPKKEADNLIDGLVQLHGPNQLESDSDQRFFKKNKRFSEEDALLGRDIGLQFRRIIRMLQLAEQQIWLVNEIAHSVAQPLQVMRSDMTYLIRELMGADVDTQKARTLAEDTGQSYEMIHEALNQLSFFTRMGKSEWVFQNTSLKQLLMECCTFMAKTARLNNLRPDYSQVQDIPLVPIEQAWMRKAILNLLHNACKYSWKAEHIKIALEEKDSNIIIKVINWGIGIPKEDKDKIFNAYFRSMVDDRYGVRQGTGIGLSIVKTAIETIHQGIIDVESKLKHGGPDGQVDNEIANKRHRNCFKITLNRKTLNTMLSKGNKS